MTQPNYADLQVIVSEDEMDRMREALLDVDEPIPEVDSDPYPVHPDDPAPVGEPT